MPLARRHQLAVAGLVVALGVSWTRDATERKRQAWVGEAWVDAAEQMELRWHGDATQLERPQLGWFPQHEQWAACVDVQPDTITLRDGERCDMPRLALRLFPPRDAERGAQLATAAGLSLAEETTLRPHVMSWFAGRDADELAYEPLLLWALAEADALGLRGAEQADAEAQALERAAALERFRSALDETCGSCAPAPAAPEAVAQPTLVRTAELALRGTTPLESDDARRDVVVAVREQRPVPDGAWTTPGLAGLAALELGRRDAPGDLELVLAAIADGPSAPDRLAALYAADRLAADADLRTPRTGPASAGASTLLAWRSR